MIVTHIAREQITVSNSAIGLDDGSSLTVSEKSRIRYAEIQVQGYYIRTTFDGSTTPVASTTGQLWSPGDLKRAWGWDNCKNLQCIREGSSDATLIVDYWGDRG